MIQKGSNFRSRGLTRRVQRAGEWDNFRQSSEPRIPVWRDGMMTTNERPVSRSRDHSGPIRACHDGMMPPGAGQRAPNRVASNLISIKREGADVALMCHRGWILRVEWSWVIDIFKLPFSAQNPFFLPPFYPKIFPLVSGAHSSQCPHCYWDHVVSAGGSSAWVFSLPNSTWFLILQTR